ncbi:MAG: hypothetical protein SCALA702_32700 [Melioribacteraceae bacterium]|nr:MAG: hypothetical protein SCALA702_32700 [Melioribacteraceae bacterium]
MIQKEKFLSKSTKPGFLSVKELVEKNHGSISVKNELNKGSKFTVTLNKFII